MIKKFKFFLAWAARTADLKNGYLNPKIEFFINSHYLLATRYVHEDLKNGAKSSKRIR